VLKYIFDGDHFLQHNSFRSPGAASEETLKKELKKVQYFKDEYSRLHRGIFAHPANVDATNMELITALDFVFVAIDNGNAREVIINNLLLNRVTFIDVGLGINIVDNTLIGTTRVTTGSPEKFDHLKDRLPIAETDNNDYNFNIQIADLNALNAVMAVIKWKKLVGFYQDLENEFHSSYSINVSEIFNEDRRA
jgi:hypothetical protein